MEIRDWGQGGAYGGGCLRNTGVTMEDYNLVFQCLETANERLGLRGKTSRELKGGIKLS